MATELLGFTAEVVRYALNVDSLRHQTIAQNIANATTPGYRPYELTFNGHFDALREAVRSGSEVSRTTLEAAQPVVEQSFPNVDETIPVALDMEAAKLAQNVLHYQAVAKAYSQFASLYGIALNDGRR